MFKLILCQKITQRSNMEKQNTATGKATKGKKMNLLNAIEKIVTNCSEKGVTDEVYTKSKKEISYVAKTMSLTPIQAIIFSLFINRSDDQYIYLNEISRDIQCSTVSMLKYSNDIDTLVERNLIKRRIGGDRKSYRR